MDGLRMVDEWQAFNGEVPAETVVFRRRGSIEEYRHSPACRATPSPIEAERVFLLVDGRASVRRVIDLAARQLRRDANSCSSRACGRSGARSQRRGDEQRRGFDLGGAPRGAGLAPFALLGSR
jgi:hypothetical protein